MKGQTTLSVKNKIPWVTLAKFIGLYMMVLGHMNLVSEEWGRFIFIFHMPLFFILSGMLYKESNDKVLLFKKLYRQLIVPFLLIALIWCVIYMVLWAKNGIWDYRTWVGYSVGTFLSPGKTFLWFHSHKQPLWFLLALAEIKIMAYYLRKPWLMVSFSLLSAIAILVFSHFHIVLPLAIDSALFAFPFYTMGILLKQYLFKEFSVILNIALSILFIMLTFIVYRLNGVVDTNRCLFGNIILLYYLGGIVGTLWVIHFSKAITSCISIGGGIITIVSGAMLVIGFSNNLSSFIRVLLPFLGNNNLGGMIIGLLTLAVLTPVIIIAKKYFPAILGYRK